MVQILGSAHGWKACREGWDEEVSLSGDGAFAKLLHGSFFLHLAACGPRPFPQSWGEQDGKLSLLGCLFPFLDMLPFCLCQYNVQCLSHPSTRELPQFSWEEPLNVRGRDGDCISVHFTVKCLWIKLAGSALWQRKVPLLLADARKGPFKAARRTLHGALVFHKKKTQTFVFYDVDLK